MRRIALLVCLLLLTGCSALPAEERAFAVVLGLGEHGGTWQVCARVPTYQTGGGYMTVEANGGSLGEAMARLNAAAPVSMHFGQLRMLVFTKELAESRDFRELLRALSARGEVREQAALCVTESELSTLMDALQPATGSRLSKSIENMMEARRLLGVLPDATLSSVRRMGERQQPVLMDATVEDGSLRLSGGWLMGASGRIQGRLTPEEMQLLSLLQGKLRQGALTLGEGTITLLDADASAQLQGDQVVCQVRVKCSASYLTEQGIQEALLRDLHALVSKLSAAGCDALGLARQAVQGASTMAHWHDADWPARYPTLPWFFTVTVDWEA